MQHNRCRFMMIDAIEPRFAVKYGQCYVKAEVTDVKLPLQPERESACAETRETVLLLVENRVFSLIDYRHQHDIPAKPVLRFPLLLSLWYKYCLISLLMMFQCVPDFKSCGSQPRNY